MYTHLRSRRPFAFPRTTATRRKREARFDLESLEVRLAPANFTVGTLADDGSTDSLRSEIYQANQLAEASTITIPQTLFQTVNTGNGLLDVIPLNGTELPMIMGQLTIVGESPDIPHSHFGITQFSISGGGQSRVFDVADNASLSLTNLRILNGYTLGQGGGIQ